MEQESKKCNRCLQILPKDQFYLMKGKAYKPGWNCRDSQCTKCRIKTSVDRLRAIKQQCVEYLGGKCEDCGLQTDKWCVYDFHHKDPTQKEYAFGSTKRRTFEGCRDELDKCVLLCSNCHRIRHYGELV